MATVLAWKDAVDIGGGRGRLAGPAAASLARVDVAMRSAFGRAADINEAWRSPDDADENARRYQAWVAYQQGRGPKVPWAPIGFPADESIHCRGYAIDTDDTSDEQMRIWNDHGWFWTVYRDGKLIERWHLEYFIDRDNHRHEGTPAFVVIKPKEWDEMASREDFKQASREALLEVLGGQTMHGIGGMPTPIKASNGALALVGEFSAQVLDWDDDEQLWKGVLYAHGIRTGDIPDEDVLAPAHFDLIVARAEENGKRFREALALLVKAQ